MRVSVPNSSGNTISDRLRAKPRQMTTAAFSGVILNGFAPDSRRIIVSAWNVGELEHMALMPCHALFQLYVAARRLSCQVYQRSADIFLGVPFNLASYALLTHMLAQQCDLVPGELVWTGGDCHLYINHLEQADEQLARTPFAAPRLLIRRRPPSLFQYAYEDFEFVDYRHHPAIQARVAV